MGGSLLSCKPAMSFCIMFDRFLYPIFPALRAGSWREQSDTAHSLSMRGFLAFGFFVFVYCESSSVLLWQFQHTPQASCSLIIMFAFEYMFRLRSECSTIGIC